MDVELLTIAELLNSQKIKGKKFKGQKLDGQNRFLVPVYQRGYVWRQFEEWDPLWEDISELALKRLDSGSKVKPHFIGAVVIEESRVSRAKEPISVFSIVDGQQRIITMQIIFAAIHKFAIELGINSIINRMPNYMFNRISGNERLKVYPNARGNGSDRALFDNILTLSMEDLKFAHYDSFKSAGRRTHDMDSMVNHTTSYGVKNYDSRVDVPRMLGAFGYYHDRIIAFCDENHTTPKRQCLNALIGAVANSLSVATIFLEKKDNAQLIFETVNGRGKPLLQTDLIKNEIFRRAGGEKSEQLFEKYWSYFEEPFWDSETSKGRIKKIMLDDFFQCFLESKSGKSVEPAHLFTEYKKFIGNNPYGKKVPTELADLVKHGKIYSTLRRYEESSSNEDDNKSLVPLAEELDALKASTLDSLVLSIWSSNQKELAKTECLKILIAFIVRRGICGLTEKDYNKYFLSITKKVIDKKRGKWSKKYLISLLKETVSETSKYPNDSEFKRDFTLVSTKKSHEKFILSKIEEHQNKEISWFDLYWASSIEHVLPESWVNHWPLNGIQPTEDEVWDARYKFGGDVSAGDEIHQQINKRDAAVNTIGNLTLLSRNQNIEAGNKPFKEKCKVYADDEIATMLTKSILGFSDWDEDAITERGRKLFIIARKIWPDIR